MAFYLNRTGRPIVLTCEYPLYQGKKVCCFILVTPKGARDNIVNYMFSVIVSEQDLKLRDEID